MNKLAFLEGYMEKRAVSREWILSKALGLAPGTSLENHALNLIRKGSDDDIINALQILNRLSAGTGKEGKRFHEILTKHIKAPSVQRLMGEGQDVINTFITPKIQHAAMKRTGLGPNDLLTPTAFSNPSKRVRKAFSKGKDSLPYRISQIVAGAMPPEAAKVYKKQLRTLLKAIKQEGKGAGKAAGKGVGKAAGKGAGKAAGKAEENFFSKYKTPLIAGGGAAAGAGVLGTLAYANRDV